MRGRAAAPSDGRRRAAADGSLPGLASRRRLERDLGDSRTTRGPLRSRSSRRSPVVANGEGDLRIVGFYGAARRGRRCLVVRGLSWTAARRRAWRNAIAQAGMAIASCSSSRPQRNVLADAAGRRCDGRSSSASRSTRCAHGPRRIDDAPGARWPATICVAHGSSPSASSGGQSSLGAGRRGDRRSSARAWFVHGSPEHVSGGSSAAASAPSTPSTASRTATAMLDGRRCPALLARLRRSAATRLGARRALRAGTTS